MTQLEYTLPPDAAPQRLNLFLRAQGLTAGLIKSVKYDGGGFFCGEASVHTDYIVHPGQTVRFALPPEQQTDVVPQDIPLHIAYEDDFAAVLRTRREGGSSVVFQASGMRIVGNAIPAKPGE